MGAKPKLKTKTHRKTYGTHRKTYGKETYGKTYGKQAVKKREKDWLARILALQNVPPAKTLKLMFDLSHFTQRLSQASKAA